MALEFGIHLEKVYVLYVWRLIFYICSIFKTQSPLKSMQIFSISRTKGSRDEPCKVTGTWGVVIWIPCSCPGEFKISRQVLICSWGYCSIVHRAGESGPKRSSIAPSLGHTSLWSLRTGHIQDLWGWPEASPEVANPTTDSPVGSWHFSLGRCFQDGLVPWLVDMNKVVCLEHLGSAGFISQIPDLKHDPRAERSVSSFLPRNFFTVRYRVCLSEKF